MGRHGRLSRCRQGAPAMLGSRRQLQNESKGSSVLGLPSFLSLLLFLFFSCLLSFFLTRGPSHTLLPNKHLRVLWLRSELRIRFNQEPLAKQAAGGVLLGPYCCGCPQAIDVFTSSMNLELYMPSSGSVILMKLCHDSHPRARGYTQTNSRWAF